MFYRLKQNLKLNISLPASHCCNLSDFVHRPAVLAVLLYFAVLFVRVHLKHSSWKRVSPLTARLISLYMASGFVSFVVFLVSERLFDSVTKGFVGPDTHTHTQTYSILRGNFPQTDSWLKSTLTHTHIPLFCFFFFFVPHGPWRPV